MAARNKECPFLRPRGLREADSTAELAVDDNIDCGPVRLVPEQMIVLGKWSAVSYVTPQSIQYIARECTASGDADTPRSKFIMKQRPHSENLYGLTISPIFTVTDYQSGLFESYSQMNFIFLCMADPTSMEAPFRRGVLILGRPWEVGRKAHHRNRDLLGTGVVPSVVGFALSKVAVWNTAWLHEMLE